MPRKSDPDRLPHPGRASASRACAPVSEQSVQGVSGDIVTPAAILALLDGIERHGLNAPAALAFRSALRRKGIEADHAGGLAALDDLMGAVVGAGPNRADARTAILRAAWADLLPGPGGRARP